MPRPLESPRPTIVVAVRSPASTAVGLFGGVDLDGATTVRLDAEASWTEWIDDPVTDGPAQHTFTATAFTTDVSSSEDLLMLGGVDFTLPVPSEGDVRFHASRHEFGDTKHRLVDYRFRGTSRFTEYFHPSLVATPADRSVVGPKLTLSIPSSARPPKPVIREIVPLLRWEEGSEPEQPFALRRTRRAGLRIYLDRTWYASGDDEQLAVICARGADDIGLDRKVSQWGADPVWRQKGPAIRPMLLEFDHLFHQTGYDDRDRSAYPVGAARQLPLVDDPARPNVTVLGYRPQYDTVRKLYYVDIAIDPGSAFWPFVRLVVARYQPDSLPDLHLSPTVRLDYSQVIPTRTATISRVAVDRAHVVVSGPVGHRGLPDLLGDASRAAVEVTRKVVARLEQRDAVITTDLGWVTRELVRLDVGGFDAATWVVAWEGIDRAAERRAVRASRGIDGVAGHGRGVRAVRVRPHPAGAVHPGTTSDLRRPPRPLTVLGGIRAKPPSGRELCRIRHEPHPDQLVRALPVRQPELLLEDLVIAIRAEADEPGGLGGGAAVDHVAGIDELDHSPIDRDLGATMTDHLDLHLF